MGREGAWNEKEAENERGKVGEGAREGAKEGSWDGGSCEGEKEDPTDLKKPLLTCKVDGAAERGTKLIVTSILLSNRHRRVIHTASDTKLAQLASYSSAQIKA